MMQMTAEIIESLETTKALLRAAEADAAPGKWGVMCPAEMPLMVGALPVPQDLPQDG